MEKNTLRRKDEKLKDCDHPLLNLPLCVTLSKSVDLNYMEENSSSVDDILILSQMV